MTAESSDRHCEYEEDSFVIMDRILAQYYGGPTLDVDSIETAAWTMFANGNDQIAEGLMSIAQVVRQEQAE